MRSEYFDITGKVFVPKPADVEIPILAAPPDKGFTQIGTVRAWARYGTSSEVIKEELRRRARLAGADALMEMDIGEDKKADVVFCGKVFSTKRNICGQAVAIVYDQDAGAHREDQARDPALYGL
jgi:hypothetical protein